MRLSTFMYCKGVLTLAFGVGFLLTPGLLWSLYGLGLDPAVQEILLEEVISLVQESLPQVYQEIGGEPVFEGENGFMIFLQDVVPHADNESITQSLHLKGEWSC